MSHGLTAINVCLLLQRLHGLKYSRVFNCGLAGEPFVAESADVWSKCFALVVWCFLRIHVAVIYVYLSRTVLDMP